MKYKFLLFLLLCGSKISMAQHNTEEIKCLASAIYQEAGGESLRGQYAVGKVIMNRVHAGFAETPCLVVKQHVGKHWQFGFNVKKKKSMTPKQREYFYNIANKILFAEDNFVLPINVLYFNNHPFDSKKYKLFCTIGKQHFYSRKSSVIRETANTIPLYGSKGILMHQNEVGYGDGLKPFLNKVDLKKAIADGSLVKMHESKFLIVNHHIETRSYCRPWVSQFLVELAEAFYKQFNKPIVVTSMVRTIEVQRHLIKINKNAANYAGKTASPHLLGIAVDIDKKKFSSKELDWMRNYLTYYGLLQFIDVEEEFKQQCFHISVYRNYMFGNNLGNFYESR
jgi:hypothetical protein